MHVLTVNRYSRLLGVSLLVLAGFSTGLRHAHPGGAANDHDAVAHLHGHAHDHAHHSHAGADRELHASGPHDCSSHVHATTFDACESGWFASQLHMHIFVLGFQFTLPASDNSDNSPEDLGREVTLQHYAGEQLLDSSDRATVEGVPILGAPSIVTLCVVPATPAWPGQSRWQTAPLCDAARHERSGVLRA